VPQLCQRIQVVPLNPHFRSEHKCTTQILNKCQQFLSAQRPDVVEAQSGSSYLANAQAMWTYIHILEYREIMKIEEAGVIIYQSARTTHKALNTDTSDAGTG